jgi:alkyl sulfatase BDS1-like metallo-beta-lactamase superfamily hydrolase
MSSVPNDALRDRFESDASKSATAARGLRAHRDLIAHTDRFRRALWTVRPGVWCLTGNALAKQTFAEEPEGLILIDTVDSVKEKPTALVEVRTVSHQPAATVHVLRVLLDPHRASGVDATLRWQCGGGAQTGLQVRNALAVPTDGTFAEGCAADFMLPMSIEAWADLASDKRSLNRAVGAEAVRIDDDLTALQHALACFDHPTLAQ